MINDLEKKNKSIENRLKMNKIFTFMVIHDLKHPTEAIIDSLKNLDEEISQNISEH